MNTEENIINLAQELIRIPSESSKPCKTSSCHPEKRVTDYLATICSRYKVSYELQEALPERFNFIAKFPHPDPKAPKLLIAAHMDTVSTDQMPDPFGGRITDNKIGGRGACDDKGPMAAALSTLLDLHKQGKKMNYDVTFAATIDEECTMSGSKALDKRMGTWDLCLCLEPTSLKVINAHKGVYRCKITTKGLAAHSSAPQDGRNAIIEMYGIMKDLLLLDFRIRRVRDPGLGRASLAITQIHGGSSINIIPDHCEISIDARLLPEQDPDFLAQTISQLVQNGKVEEIFTARGIRTDMDDDHIRKFQKALSNCGLPTKAECASYATDCSQLVKHGPCIIWGPGHIEQAHKPHEHIEISQLRMAGKVLKEFLCFDLI